ncbi:alpha-glucosidase [Haloglomus litoreum]|uniref:alpha-glucosidase n=1 Tax=Haloglomus litoreum TaxID=3034026 RepID=UPI0023E79AE8|nr:alpha-glucosidase [Haloglomus sp. DT116]
MDWDSDRRRFLRAAGATGLAAGLAGCTSFSDPPGAGSITGRPPSVTYDIGDYRVLWDDPDESGDGTPALRVTHPGTGTTLLRSIRGENVLAAARATLDVTERRGTFELDETTETAFVDQRVRAVTPGTAAVGDPFPSGVETVTLSGLLTADDGEPVDYELAFAALPDGHCGLSASVGGEADRLRLRYRTPADERVYGFGEQFSHVDLKGHEVPIVTQEQGIGRGRPIVTQVVNAAAPGAGGGPFSTYAPMPYALSDAGYGLCLENASYSVFDLRRRREASARVYADRLRARLFPAPTLAAGVERFTAYAGRMPPLPEWLNRGAVVDLQGGTEKVREVWAELRARDTPLAGVWLQDWVGARETSFGSQLWWNWELDEATYPGWDDLVADLHDAGVGVLGYVNPYLADVSGKSGVDRNLFREAREADYLVTESGSDEPYMLTITDFDVGILDLSNDDARAWFRAVMRENVLDKGFDGWMADFGEGLPFEADLDDAEADSYHNHYPVEWAALNRQVVEAASEDGSGGDRRLGRPTFFTRAGFTRSPGESTLFWTGDQLVSWDDHDGLGTVVPALLSSGLSGVSLNHPDAGGYTSIVRSGVGVSRSREELLRWLELSAFTPVYRTHEGNQPGENAQIYDDDGTYDAFARFAKVYAALASYREELMQVAANRGLPLVRPLAMHYPGDDIAAGRDDQFLLGRDVLVAPVTERNVRDPFVYLPDGEWRHLWSGEVRQGRGWRRVLARLGEPPVFLRVGSDIAAALPDRLRSLDVLE